MSNDNMHLKELLARVEKLEKVMFRSKKEPAVEKRGGRKSYSGATGGLRMLIDQGYFGKKRTFGEIRKALEQKGYHYSPQAVQTPLNTLSSSARGPLVAFSEKGRKVYARRK